MARNKKNLHHTTLWAARAHFGLVLAFSAYIIVADASNLMTPDAVLQRWKYCLALMVVTTLTWMIARTKRESKLAQNLLIGLLVTTDIVVASLLVYAERGMASVSVSLYALPIATAALTYSRSAILTSASLSTAAYAFASIKYFVDFFNEGYRVQLYSTIGFYSAIFFVLAVLLVAIVKGKPSK